jgi:hypothetical protein
VSYEKTYIKITTITDREIRGGKIGEGGIGEERKPNQRNKTFRFTGHLQLHY